MYLTNVDAQVPMLARIYEKRLKGYHAIRYSLEADAVDFVAAESLRLSQDSTRLNRFAASD